MKNLVLFLACIFPFALFAQLSGTYTIDGGGYSGDYYTIQSAFDDLSAEGMSGSVTFELLPGSGPYYEQVHISSGGTIGMEVTLNGNGETVKYSPTDPENRSILKIDSASYVNIQNLHILTEEDALYGWGVHIANGSDNIRVSDCHIEGLLENESTWDKYAGIVMNQSYSDPDYTGGVSSYHNIEILNNHIDGASYGVTVACNSTHVGSNVNITGNTFDLSWQGIYTFFVDDLKVNNNEVLFAPSAESSSASRGIELQHTNAGAEIIGNRIPTVGWFGIHIYQAHGTAANPIKMHNNMVGGVSRQIFFLVRDVLISSCDTVEFYHNSIKRTGSEGKNFEVLSSTGIDVRNNSFLSTGGGYCVFAYDPTDFTHLDYNNYYRSSGSRYAFWNSVNMNTLADLQAAPLGPPGKALNATSLEPNYLGVLDLHATGFGLEGSAFPGLVATDYDGEERSPTTPDRGADEYTNPLNEVAPIALIGPLGAEGSGNLTLTTRFRNGGTDTLTSFDVYAHIKGEILDTLLGPLSITGGSAPYDQEFNINLANLYFPRDYYDFTIWTQNPNGSEDGHKSNDTLRVLNILLCNGFSGTVTVDPSIPRSEYNFQDFNTLSDFLQSCGITSSLIVDVAPGLYEEQVTFYWVPGSDSLNTITIQGNNSTMQFSPQTPEEPHVWKLSGADFYILEDIRFKIGPGAACGWNLWFWGIADDNIVRNCIFQNKTNKGSNYKFSNLVMTNVTDENEPLGNAAHNNLIENNVFNNGATGIYAAGGYNRFVDNQFNNQESYAIYMRNASNFILDGNISDQSGVVGYSTGGILVWESLRFTITNNECYNFSKNGISLDGINQFGTPEEPVVISNNILTSAISNATIFGAGMWIDGVRDAQFFNNSINIYGTNTILGYGIRLNTTSANNLSFINNSIACSTPNGIAMYISDPADFNFNDYNLYYAPASGILVKNSSNVDFFDLPSIQAYTGKDAFSIVGDPGYLSDSVLHISSSSILIDAGSNLVGPVNDIDGDTRPDPVTGLTDIGADEYSEGIGPSCDPPAGLNAVVTSPPGGSVLMTWDDNPVANAWQVKGRKIGTGPFAQAFTILPSLSVPFSFFEEGAMYEWKVRSRCDPDDEVSGFSALDTFFIPALKIAANQGLGEIRVSPNPASTYLDLFISEWDGNAKLEIIDLNGKTLYTEFYESLGSSYHTRIDLPEGIPAGVYILQVSGNASDWSNSFIKTD